MKYCITTHAQERMRQRDIAVPDFDSLTSVPRSWQKAEYSKLKLRKDKHLYRCRRRGPLADIFVFGKTKNTNDELPLITTFTIVIP